MKLGVEIEVKSDAEGPIKSIKSQLKDARNELNAVIDKFGEMSPQAAKAAQAVARLEDKIGDAKKLTDAFNPDAKFKGLSGAISGAVGAFSALQGAQALFGNKSKELEETLAKVQGAMALSQGINSVLESKDAFIALGAQIKATTIFQKLSAAAQWVWNAAMEANPIGAVVVAVTALIAGLVALIGWLKSSSDEAKNQAKAIESSSKALDNQTKSLERNSSEFDKNSKFRVDMAKASGQSSKAIRELELKLADEKIAFERSARAIAFQTYEKEKNYLATLRASGASDELINKQIENVNKAVKAVNDQNKKIQEAVDAKRDIERRHQVEVTQEQTDGEKKRAEKKKEADEKAIEKKKEELKKELELEKERQQKITQIRQETEDLITQNRINSIKDSYTKEQSELEVKYQKEIDDALAILDDKNLKEEDRQRLYNERRTAIDEQHRLDIQALTDKHNKELEDKAKELFDKEVNRKLQSYDDLLNDNDKTYQAKKDALDKEEEYINNVNVRKALGEEEYNKKLKAITDARKNIFKAEVQARRDGAKQIGDDMGKLGDIIGKQTVAGKALAIGQATINTYLGATEALKQKSTLPSPFDYAAKALNVTAIILSGLKAVKEIVKTPVPGGGGGGEPSAANITGGAAPIPATPETTILPQGQIDQIASANAATRAYVVESDVTSNQERITRLNRAARIN